MNKLTSEQIIDILKVELPPQDFVLQEPYSKNLGDMLGECIQVHQHGGEGQGVSYYVVNYFPKHDVYIRTDGYYSSYDGLDVYDFGHEVFPKEKTITVYEN